MVPLLIVLLIAYTIAVVWQARRAVAAVEEPARLREARRLLWIVSAGAPLAAVLILVAL